MNIFDIKPNKVSRKLDGYPMVFIGQTGDGKTYSLNKFLTEIATDGKKPLFLMFEDRYKNIDGIYALRIKSISDIIQVKAQLQQQQAKDMYSCVVIDTIDKFEEMASRYTASNKNVEIVEDLTFGKGNKYLNSIIGIVGEIRNLGYPVHFVAQAVTTEDIVSKTTKTQVKLKPSTKAQIFQDAFLVGMVYPDPRAKGNIDADRLITFKKSSVNVDLKDVFGMPDSCKISELPSVLLDVIEKKYGDNVTDDNVMEEIKIDGNFDEILQECKKMGNLLFSNNLANEAMAILSTNLGTNEDGSAKNLNQIHEGQLELLKVVHFQLSEMMSKHKLKIQE